MDHLIVPTNSDSPMEPSDGPARRDCTQWDKSHADVRGRARYSPRSTGRSRIASGMVASTTAAISAIITNTPSALPNKP